MGDKLRIYGTDGVLQEFDPIDAAGTIAFTGAQSMGDQKLTSVAAPTDDGDALSKGDAVLVGTEVATIADSNVIGGIPVIHIITVSGTGKAAINVTLTHKEFVFYVWLVLKGAGVAGGTVTIGNAANGITNAMGVTGSDKAIVRAGTIDDAYQVIAAAGTLRATLAADGANAAPCAIYVLAFRTA